ncbi:hypothetical protein J7L68_08665, partial [bacterium]|nr:hypothetical protein [bacterium]
TSNHQYPAEAMIKISANIIVFFQFIFHSRWFESVIAIIKPIAEILSSKSFEPFGSFELSALSNGDFSC